VKPIWIGCHRKSEPRSMTAVGWTRCEVCHTKVWIAPASLAIKKDSHYPNVVIACLECWTQWVVEKAITDPAGPPELHTTAQQEMELFSATGKTITEFYREAYGITPKRLK